MSSLVSIVLPTRNSIQYLKDRIDSIRAQTYSNYEVVAVDTSSTDGTLELLRAWAHEDCRVAIYDTPPGLYEAFNFGIIHSKGEYVYMATSDDTMRMDLLEKMVGALEQHPDCDICDSLLKQIDKDGKEIEFGDEGYLYGTGHLVYPKSKAHIRRPPYDFIQHCGAQNAYLSLTQLLVRRSLYGRVGLFPVDMGPSADFLWGMRAAACASVIFIPEKLGTFRVHPGQTTGLGAKFKGKFNRTSMVKIGFQEHECVAESSGLIRLADFKACIMPLKFDVSLIEKLRAAFCGIARHPLFSLEYMLALLSEKYGCHCPYWKVSAYDVIHRRLSERALKKYPVELV